VKGRSCGETNDGQKNVFDLGAFVYYLLITVFDLFINRLCSFYCYEKTFGCYVTQ
jgi:hypothetical protein